MAINLSIYVGKSLTDQQYAAYKQATNHLTDFVAKGKGSQLACSYSGWVITYGTGQIEINGRTVEVTAQDTITFPTPGASGTAMVIAKVNLATGVATIELKVGTTLTQNDLVANPTGIREVELYRFIYTTSAITSFVDKRVVTTMQETINALDTKYNTRVPANSLVLQDFSFFKPSVNQNITAGQTPTIALVRQVGGLSIDGSYYITLPKGYFYELDFGLAQLVSAGNGALAIARIVKSDGTATGYGTDAGAIGVTNATGRMDTPNGTHIIDLTGAGADVVIKYMLAYTDVNCTINKDSTFVKIKQYKKAV